MFFKSTATIEEFSYFNPDTERRVALITGGNSGVGFHTALHLYLHGYIVYIASRSRSRFAKLCKELHQRATSSINSRVCLQNDQLKKDDLKNSHENRQLGELHFLDLDLTSLQSVLRAVELFKAREKDLHLLINNAGVMALPYTLTQDNFDIQLQTNFISPFLLTLKLLPILERTSERYPFIERPRVVYLSSVGHQFAYNYFNLSSPMNYSPNFIFTWVRYGIAKTAGIHFMKMLSLRNPKILCLCVHPGFVMNTNIFSYWTNLPLVGILFWCFFQLFSWFFGVTAEQGANTILQSSLNPDLTLEKSNGKYYGNQGNEIQPSKVASNMDYAARTWIWTVRELSERGITILDL